MIIKGSPLDSLGRSTFGSPGTRASPTPAIRRHTAAAAPIRRSGCNQPAYFICLPSIRRQVRDKRRPVVYFLQSLGDRDGRHHHATVLRVVEAEIAAEAVDVAVERRANHLRLR